VRTLRPLTLRVVTEPSPPGYGDAARGDIPEWEEHETDEEEPSVNGARTAEGPPSRLHTLRGWSSGKRSHGELRTFVGLEEAGNATR
jgi:hypothetical protein